MQLNLTERTARKRRRWTQHLLPERLCQLGTVFDEDVGKEIESASEVQNEIMERKIPSYGGSCCVR